MTVTLDSNLYPWVMFVAALASFECLIVGFMAGGKRGKFFNAEFMQQFADDHKAMG